jgi:hypothetical protein
MSIECVGDSTVMAFSEMDFFEYGGILDIIESCIAHGFSVVGIIH